jgi:chemotaxis protein MotB
LDLGSFRLKLVTRQFRSAIAREVSRLLNQVVPEGHTDARPDSFSRGVPPGRRYSNWELSTDRANSARRAMEEAELRSTKVARVIGHADRHPLNPKNPLHTANRRISILVRYLTTPTEGTAPSTGLRTGLLTAES